MPAYDPRQLDALATRALAEKYQPLGWPDAAQAPALAAAYPAVGYTPPFFIRAALFLFTTFLTLCATGLLALMLLPILTNGNNVTYGTFALFCAAFTGLALIYFVRARRHYRSGIDDALLYATVGLLLTGAYFLFSDQLGRDALPYLLVALPVLGLATWWTGDRLLAVAALGCALGVVGTVLLKWSGGQATLPFAGMAAGAGTYAWATARANRYALRYWTPALRTLELAALLVFYGSGNYLVVREGNLAISKANFRTYENATTRALEARRNQLHAEALQRQALNDALASDPVANQEAIAQNQRVIDERYEVMSQLYDQINAVRLAEQEQYAQRSVPLRGLFIAFTALVPLGWLVVGLRRRRRALLWAGVATTVLAVATLHYYLPANATGLVLALAGALATVAAYAALRWLARPANQSRARLSPADSPRSEALQFAQSFGPPPGAVSAPPAEPGFRFGGGELGGGGAGSDY